MTSRRLGSLGCCALALVGLCLAQATQAQETITYRQAGATTTAFNNGVCGDDSVCDGRVPEDAIPTHASVTDFSASGLNLGTAGYWFFNFAQSANTGSAPEFGEVEALPSWVVVDKTSADPATRTLSDGSVIHTSNGGNGYDTLTLPEASGPLTGESGVVVAAGSFSDSKNIFENMFLTADTPDQFLMHFVMDNTNGAHDIERRLKFRARTEAALEINMRLDNMDRVAANDNETDVYTFIMSGWGEGDELRMQIRGRGNDFNPQGIAGIMFDVIPEPTSLALLGVGVLGMGLTRKRRS